MCPQAGHGGGEFVEAKVVLQNLVVCPPSERAGWVALLAQSLALAARAEKLVVINASDAQADVDELSGEEVG